MLTVVSQFPKPTQGANGDMLLYQTAGIASLLLKSNNRWASIPLSFGHKKKTNLSYLSYSHDTGWFPVQSPSDSTQFPDVANSNGMTPGKYRIKHNSGTAFVKAELYCRFTALNNGNQEKYTINLTSHVSYLGPKSSSYGYFIRIIDNNTFDLHIHEHGLTMLYSELFDDGTYKDLIVTSKDAGGNQLTDVEFPAVEVRAFVYPIKKETTEPITNHVVPGPNTNHHIAGVPIDHGNKVIGDKQAAVNGTNDTSFVINAAGQGAAENPASYQVHLIGQTGALAIKANNGGSGSLNFTDISVDKIGAEVFKGRLSGNDIVVGGGTGNATIESNGDHSLRLQTGNSDTGSIVITDGDNQDISITPAGTGKVDVDGDLNLTSGSVYKINGTALAAANISDFDTEVGNNTTVAGKANLSGASFTGDVTFQTIAGFEHAAEETIGSTADLTVDFNENNKRRIRFTAGSVTISNLRMYFPDQISGSFILVVKNSAALSSGVTDSAIGTWKVYNGTVAANHPANQTDVIWHGGSSKKPTISTTANKVDIFSFYWDSEEEICYGQSGIGFSA